MEIINRHILPLLAAQIRFLVVAVAAKLGRTGHVSLSLPHRKEGYVRGKAELVVLDAPIAFMGQLALELAEPQYAELEIFNNVLKYKKADIIHVQAEKQPETETETEAPKAEEVKAEPAEETEAKPKLKRVKKKVDE